MGRPNEWSSAAGLLRQRAARCDGGGLARFLWGLFRHDGRAGLRLGRRRRYLEADRARSSRGAFGRSADAAMIRVVLPHHLRTLAKVGDEVQLEVAPPVTQRAILDALEARYPV